MIFFTVHGQAEPAGSKKAYRNPHTDRVVVVDANPNARPWKQEVASVASEHMEGLVMFSGPVAVTMTFYRPRLRSHYGTGRNAERLRDSAPAFPATRPDALKLARAVEDAMAGIVYRDDAQIVSEHLHKRWGEPRVDVFVEAVLSPADCGEHLGV